MPATAPLTLRLLQRLCYDTLQRSPTAAERRTYLGMDTAAVAARLVQSREGMAAWFEEELFYFLLIDQFRPRGDTVDQIPERLQRGKLSARDAIGEILLSTGFSLRNPGNDTFVTVVLEQCLGYRVQDRKVAPILAAGKQLYDGKRGKFLNVQGGSQADVIQITLHHADFARHLLARHHLRLLGQPLAKDAPEVAAVAADAMQFFPVLTQWLCGETYAAAAATPRAKSERQFLRGIYSDLLERVPDHDELRNLRNAMQSMADPAPLRAVLAKLMLDSGQCKLPDCRQGEEAAFVRECFHRYLGRDPGQDEGQKYLQALTQEGVRPALLVRALVGSLEYQTY